jgi:DNA-binding NtrC family response regulator
MSGAKILVVDDELIVRESLGGWLTRDGHSVDKASSGEEALAKCESTRYDIVLLDIKMEGMSGLDVLKKLKESDPDVAVVMITAYGSIPSAIEAMKNGAHEYLLKPFDPDELMILIEKIVQYQAQTRETQFLRDQYRETTRFESMMGQSRALQEVFDLIERIAPTDSTVLIKGETGTGKGLAARAIHNKSRRCQGPFVVVNCGAFPEHLLESELFGYQKGAFTDAKTTKKGRLELAHGGTLLLDEIGEISMRMQIDLLRVIEDHVFYRVGGTQPIEADFRIVAATNKNLEKAIREGSFREDLFYRLNVISFVMPPLREHKEDIPLLADYFLHRFTQETNKKIDRVSREALDEMMLYDWPGNVRELANALERAVVVSRGRKVLPQDLPIFRPEFVVSPPCRTLREMEIVHLTNVLNATQWNISKSAETLGIDRSTLYEKIKRYDIRKPG